MPPDAFRLTTRDITVLTDLGDQRFLSAHHLAALHFASPRAAATRMRALVNAKLAHAVFMPVRPFDRGSVTIWALSAKGAMLVRQHREGARPTWLSTNDRRSALFLDHTLRRNDVRVCLEQLHLDRRGFQLLSWRQAPEHVRGSATVSVHGNKRYVPIVPDGVFRVLDRGREYVFCLETDMGTISPVTMAIRYRAYHRWWKTGGMARRFGNAPLRVLTMTTTPSRLAKLRSAALVAPEGTRRGSGLFWFTLLDVADVTKPERLLDAVWTVARVGDHDPHPLFPS